MQVDVHFWFLESGASTWYVMHLIQLYTYKKNYYWHRPVSDEHSWFLVNI